MPIFVVIATKEARQVGERIRAVQSDPEGGITSCYELKPDTWFVAYDGTTRQLAEALGVRSGETGSGVVVSVENYSGRAGSDLWEWLRINSKD
jgi:hypothetical protein